MNVRIEKGPHFDRNLKSAISQIIKQALQEQEKKKEA